MSFDQVPQGPEDPIFSLSVNYKKDTHPQKLDLGVGAYRTEEGSPYVLQVVRKAEAIIQNNVPQANKEYLPISGNDQFLKGATKLVFGEGSRALAENRICAIQTLGGTGALYIGAIFLYNFLKGKTIYFSNPTWGNHKNIFERAGLKTGEYRYYDNQTHGLHLSGLVEDLRNAPDNSIILLHACAHNPTGIDPTMEQWGTIADVIKEKNHFPFFDFAYQGFATGNLDVDAQAIRLFVERGFECLVAQSFSKNLGLYCERLGCLSVVANNPNHVAPVKSQLERIVRAVVSNPPAHGSRVAAIIFNDDQLYAEWQAELHQMSLRLQTMRSGLYTAIIESKTPGTWTHLQSQIGMFSFLGLSSEQVKVLVEKYHIYLTSNGRISVAGLSQKTIPYLASAINEVVSHSRL